MLNQEKQKKRGNLIHIREKFYDATLDANRTGELHLLSELNTNSRSAFPTPFTPHSQNFPSRKARRILWRQIHRVYVRL